MPENFIVTIYEKVSNAELDLEIPALLPFGEFKDKLLEILRALEPRAFAGWRNIGLVHNGVELLYEESLASVCAYDGSVLLVVRK